eukprot:6206189-Pleurochrysis_carterae.AAC.2
MRAKVQRPHPPLLRPRAIEALPSPDMNALHSQRLPIAAEGNGLCGICSFGEFSASTCIHSPDVLFTRPGYESFRFVLNHVEAASLRGSPTLLPQALAAFSL